MWNFFGKMIFIYTDSFMWLQASLFSSSVESAFRYSKEQMLDFPYLNVGASLRFRIQIANNNKVSFISFKFTKEFIWQDFWRRTIKIDKIKTCLNRFLIPTISRLSSKPYIGVWEISDLMRIATPPPIFGFDSLVLY